LRFLGFGSPQDGLWISPRDYQRKVVELVGQLQVSDHCCVLVASSAPGSVLDALIARTWDLEGLANRFVAFNAAFDAYAGRARPRVQDNEAFVIRTLAVDAFRQFASLDPELPDAQPTARLRAETLRTFDRLDRALAPAANRFLDRFVGVR
jgi:phenylacetic acid degradation operon negative regulatory protein